MGRVNSSIVEAICKKKLSEPSIQSKISKVQRKAIISGKKPNDISEIKMLQAGNQLLQTILNHFPTSLSKLKPELSTSVSEIKTSDGYYRIDIEFPEDVVRRKSLYPEKYEGIDNIISLFNNLSFTIPIPTYLSSLYMLYIPFSFDTVIFTPFIK